MFYFLYSFNCFNMSTTNGKICMSKDNRNLFFDCNKILNSELMNTF